MEQISKARFFAGLRIIKVTGEYARVYVNQPAFMCLTRRVDGMPFATARTADGKSVRVYDIEGTKIYTHTVLPVDFGDKTVVTPFMKLTDAQALGAATADDAALELDIASLSAA